LHTGEIENKISAVRFPWDTTKILTSHLITYIRTYFSYVFVRICMNTDIINVYVTLVGKPEKKVT